MKVAQLVGVWVLALAVGVVAATLVWTTWLESEPAAAPEPLSDAERVWCSNNIVWVMLAALPLGLDIPEDYLSTVGGDDDVALYLLWQNLFKPSLGFWADLDGWQQGTQNLESLLNSAAAQVQGDFVTWVGGESISDFYDRAWTTAPFDRMCRAAFEGK